jgi:branched-chain amino acid aminotransferase
MNRPVWRDGQLIDRSEATISALAHPMQRGSLVFDVASFHDTPRGVAVFRLREHVARFLRSSAIVGLQPAFDEQQLIEGTRAAVAATKLKDGLIRISGVPPDLEADLVPREPHASVVIAAYARDDFPKKHKSPPNLRIRVPSDVRKAAPDAIPPLAKVAASYLGPMIARRRALEEGFDEVVLLDHRGRVAEAPTANVMCVIAGKLVTPPLGSILDGITRNTILELAREEGVPAEERDLSYEELAAADEAFLTATSYLVAPIAAIDEHPKNAPGPLTARLKARFTRVIAGEDARSAEWLLPVE